MSDDAVEDVFYSLEQDRQSGALSKAIAAGNVRYQISRHRPGMLEEVHPDSRIVMGRFVDGRFVAEEGFNEP